ncbi:MAG: hypothetical protein V2J24_07340 [Pseudomonadales bacterium]|jgi:hypothetical protein|nr:hypothetical protein [Pseudomonadales bacterium]
MFLVKTSAKVLDTVRSDNKQLFRGEPKGWEAGEAVLFIRNKGDLEEGEKPIAVAAKIAKIRSVEGSEATDLASGVGGTFKFVAEYDGVTELVAPFDLAEAIGEQAAEAYKRVSIARKVEAGDATQLESFLKARAPTEAAPAEAETDETPAGPEPRAAAPKLAKGAPAKTEAPKSAAPKPASLKAPPVTPPTETPRPASVAAAAASGKAAKAATNTKRTTKTVVSKSAAAEAEAAKAPSVKSTDGAEASTVSEPCLPWYLQTIELSRLGLAFFTVGTFILGAVIF